MVSERAGEVGAEWPVDVDVGSIPSVAGLEVSKHFASRISESRDQYLSREPGDDWEQDWHLVEPANFGRD